MACNLHADVVSVHQGHDSVLFRDSGEATDSTSVIQMGRVRCRWLRFQHWQRGRPQDHLGWRWELMKLFEMHMFRNSDGSFILCCNVAHLPLNYFGISFAPPRPSPPLPARSSSLLPLLLPAYPLHIFFCS